MQQSAPLLPNPKSLKQLSSPHTRSPEHDESSLLSQSPFPKVQGFAEVQQPIDPVVHLVASATSSSILEMSASLLLMAAALFEIPAALLLMAAALFETPAALLLMAAALFETSVTMLLMAAS